METTTLTNYAPEAAQLETTKPNLWIKGVQKYKGVLDKLYKTMFLNAKLNYLLKQNYNNKHNLTYRHWLLFFFNFLVVNRFVNKRSWLKCAWEFLENIWKWRISKHSTIWNF